MSIEALRIPTFTKSRLTPEQRKIAALRMWAQNKGSAGLRALLHKPIEEWKALAEREYFATTHCVI